MSKKKALILALLILAAIGLPGQYNFINLGLPGTYGSIVCFADYNLDSDLDIVLSGSVEMSGLGQTYLYDNAGNFVFNSVNPPFIDVFHSYIEFSDYNNDGYLDAVVCGLPHETAGPITKIYKGLANGLFIETPYTYTGADNACATWGDYNNDGRRDLIVTGSLEGGYNNPHTVLYKNMGNSIFQVVNADLPHIDFGSVTWIDYDQDGDLDLSFNGSFVNEIYRNDGNDVFTDINAGFSGMRYGDSVWADFDNDGDDDYICSGRNSNEITQIRHYRNNGNGSFTSIPIAIPGYHSGSMSCADYNNDGWLDLLVTGHTDSYRLAYVYQNNGSGNFTMIDYGFTEVSSGWGQWGDLNNDGKLDVVLSGYTGDSYITHAYQNIAPTANSAPLPPQVSFDPTSKMISFSGASDLETPATGLRYALRIGTSPGARNILSPCSAPGGYLQTTNPGRRNMLFDAQPGVTYYASAQAIDGGMLGSAFGEEISFVYQGASIEVVGSNTLNFDPAYYQHSSEPQSIAIRNSGLAPLTVSAVEFDNAASMFQLDATMPALPWVVAPGESFNIALRVFPTVIGNIQDSLFVLSNAYNNPRLQINLRAACVYVPPAEVQNLEVEIVGWDAVLGWDAVTANILGDPLVPDRYVVLFNEDTDDEHFWYLASTIEPDYTHYEVARFAPNMFYRVKAVKFYREEQRRRFETLLEKEEKIRWQELQEAFLPF